MGVPRAIGRARSRGVRGQGSPLGCPSRRGRPHHWQAVSGPRQDPRRRPRRPSWRLRLLRPTPRLCRGRDAPLARKEEEAVALTSAELGAPPSVVVPPAVKGETPSPDPTGTPRCQKFDGTPTREAPGSDGRSHALGRKEGTPREVRPQRPPARAHAEAPRQAEEGARAVTGRRRDQRVATSCPACADGWPRDPHRAPLPENRKGLLACAAVRAMLWTLLDTRGMTPWATS